MQELGHSVGSLVKITWLPLYAPTVTSPIHVLAAFQIFVQIPIRKCTNVDEIPAFLHVTFTREFSVIEIGLREYHWRP